MTTARARLLSIALTRIILPLALLTAVMIGLGFLLTHLLVHLWPFTLEDPAIRRLVATRTPLWDRVSDLASLIAYTTGLATVLLVAGAMMRIAYHRWREPLFLVAAMMGQLVVYEVADRVVGRARPPVPELDVFPPMRSFFSGHVAAAVTLYGGIAVVLTMHARRTAHAVIWWILLLIVPVAVAISRVFRGMHYPSDVAASFIVGLGSLAIMHRAILNPPQARGSIKS